MEKVAVVEWIERRNQTCNQSIRIKPHLAQECVVLGSSVWESSSYAKLDVVYLVSFTGVYKYPVYLKNSAFPDADIKYLFVNF